MACFEASTLYILKETDTCYISHLKRVPKNHRLKRARDLGEKCSIRDHQQEYMTYFSSKKKLLFWLYLHFPLFSPDWWRVSSKQINVQPSIFRSCIPTWWNLSGSWSSGYIDQGMEGRKYSKMPRPTSHREGSWGGNGSARMTQGRSQVRKCDVDKM